MNRIQRIQNLEHIKILTDSRRLEILRLLMDEPATLSQLGQALGEHPARVRHHLKLLERAGLVRLVETRLVRGFTEKYYCAQADAFLLQEMVLPASIAHNGLVILGSHDLALEKLAQYFGQQPNSPLNILLLPVGSLDGLVALRQGNAHLAGCHLLDVASGEYNLPFVRHILPDQQITLITLAHRQQGLMVQPGNPHHIGNLTDLAHQNITMINRNQGSGTRLWLDRQLQQAGITPADLSGYKNEVSTHTAVAQAILQGKANAGLGLQAAAQKAGLDFIPLFQERYDLALPNEHLQDPAVQMLLEHLNSVVFRKSAKELTGYETFESGHRVDS